MPARTARPLAAALAVVGSGLLAGCVPSLGPAPQPRAAGSLASAQTLGGTVAAWPGDGWWRAYGDPQLDRLIAEGLAGSPDIRVAAARIARAEAQARAAGAQLGPELSANGQAGGTKQSYNNGIPAEFVPKGIRSVGTLNLQLAFDFDLFGRNRATRRAALREADAARIDAAEARLALAATIAAGYADLARLYAERDVAEQANVIQRDSARLVADRVLNGLDTEAERRQASAQVPASRVDIAALDESIALVRNQLAALVGAGPDRGLTIARPRLGQLEPTALPADAGIALVGRRPDIVAARLRAEAAAQRIKAARAAFYPDVSLNAIAGLQSLGLTNLLRSGSSYGTAAPALSLPIFDSGRREGDYRAARAEYDDAVAGYDQTLLRALREVADAVASRRSLAVQSRDAQASLADSEAAYRVARLRYEGGLSTYLNVLSAESQVIASRRRAADLAARAFTLDVALARALGGGFVAPPATAQGQM